MSKIRTVGIEELVRRLESTSSSSNQIVQDAVKEGIGVVTDELRSKVRSLKVTEDSKNPKMRYCRQWEVDAMLSQLGYTPSKFVGTKVDRKAGFDDYATAPNGRRVAVRAIANSVNAGTSFMAKQPIFQPVIRKARAQVLEEMQRILNEELKKQGFDISKSGG